MNFPVLFINYREAVWNWISLGKMYVKSDGQSLALYMCEFHVLNWVANYYGSLGYIFVINILQFCKDFIFWYRIGEKRI